MNNKPSRTKIAIGVRKDGAILPKVTVERRGKAFKCHAEMFVKR